MDFQTFQNIVAIIGRVFFGLIFIGLILGACLHKKYKVFNDIFEGTLWLAMMYGALNFLHIAILGF